MECAVQIILQFDNQMKTLAKNIIAKNESLRKKAISDLSKMNRPSAAFLLSQCIIHDEELYSEAADALYHMGPSTIPFLYQAFLKTVQAPCAVAYSTISYFGDAAIPYLHEILKKGGDEYHINELIKHIEEKNKK